MTRLDRQPAQIQESQTQRIRSRRARRGRRTDRWWNSKGMLGRHGAVVLKRGFPATHFFAQAHVVFEVASSRSRELFNPPGCMTLWSLPAEIEDAGQSALPRLDEDEELLEVPPVGPDPSFRSRAGSMVPLRQKAGIGGNLPAFGLAPR